MKVLRQGGFAKNLTTSSSFLNKRNNYVFKITLNLQSELKQICVALLMHLCANYNTALKILREGVKKNPLNM